MHKIVMSRTKRREIFRRIFTTHTNRTQVMNVQPALLRAPSAVIIGICAAMLITAIHRVLLGGGKRPAIFARAKSARSSKI